MSKPRREKGILGVPKGSHPMLFTLANEWPSEDDSDSDYEKPTKHKKKRRNSDSDVSKCKKEKKRKKSAQSSAGSSRSQKGAKIDLEDSESDWEEDVLSEPQMIKQKRKSKSSGHKGGKQKHKSTKSKHKKAKKQQTKSVKNNIAGSSSTSEYEPSDEAELNENGRCDKKDSTRRVESSDKAAVPIANDQAWGITIPLLALERIFSHAIEGAGAVPLLCELARVCRLWREAAYQPRLWQHVDLANGRIKKINESVQWLAVNRLSQLRDLSLAGWPKLSDESLKAVTTNCPNLERINLTKCTTLSWSAVKALAETCTRLDALDLSFMDGSEVLMKTSNFTNLLEICGERLKHLVMTQCMLKACPIILKAITTSCKELRTLDLSNCRFSTYFLGLAIEELQTGCPNLRVLRLAGCKVRAQQATSRVKAESPGFAHLSELSLAVSTETTINISIGIGDQFLQRIMKNSHNLKLLDLRGLTHISARGVESLTVENLEHLYISQCSLSKYEGIEAVVQKWRHSLIELDLSWNVFPAMSLDVAMKKLCSGPSQSVLKTLNLSGTSITADRVRSEPIRPSDSQFEWHINNSRQGQVHLKGCPNLTSVNLTSCRGLPRGMKRLHEKEDMKELSKQLGVTQHQPAR